MIHRLRIFALVGLICTFSVPGFSSAPGHWAGESQYVELVNSQKWAFANMYTFADTHYYAGDTTAFNRFLKLYSRIKDAELPLVLHSGQGCENGGKIDWELTGERTYLPIKEVPRPTVKLELWTGGQVDLSKVVIPKNVQVEKEPKNTVGLTTGFRAIGPDSLGGLALFIDSVSKGKSRLLTDQGSSDGPKVSSLSSFDVRFITAYTLSSPVKTELSGIGHRTIIGAITLLAPAISPPDTLSHRLNDIQTAEPGFYLLAFNGPDSVPTVGNLIRQSVDLLHLSVDKDGNRVLVEALSVPAIRYVRTGNCCDGEDWYGVSVRFPRENEVSPNNPANRTTVQIAIKEPDAVYSSYKFQLDLQIKQK